MDAFDRVIGAPSRPVGVLFRLQVGLEGHAAAMLNDAD